MSTPTLLDQLIDILEGERDAGNEFVTLSPEVSDFLRHPGAPAAAKTAAAKPSYLDEEETPRPAASTVAAPPPPPRPTQRAPERVVERVPTPAPAASPAAADVSGLDLASLQQLVSTCRQCQLCEHRTQTVFGEGNPDADLMFIGEGPGADEDETGRPFVGKAGQLLTNIIHAMQFRREEVYIANIVKCRPPGNRNPEDDEAISCLPYLQRQIELIHPKVIVTLGAVPLKHLLNLRGITRLHGQWQSLGGIRVMPTLHPSYVLRKPEAKRDVWQDMQEVMRVFGKDPRESTRRRQ